MSRSVTRRNFIKAGAAAAVAMSVRGHAVAASSVATEVGTILSRSATNSYLQAKLALDAIIARHPASISREIDILVDAANQMAGPKPTDPYKVAAIRKAIYQGGPWNSNRPFGYDLADPLGLEVKNKLLATYMAKRLGNCVSMPALFMIVAEKMGLKASFVTAPLHVFVRFSHPERGPINIETTNGAHFTRDEWYHEKMPMTARSIESGLYMRSLTKAEGIGLLATTVLEFLIDAGRNEEAIAVADEILSVNPRDGYAMVKKGTAIGAIMKAEFQDKYPLPSLIPTNLRRRFAQLAAANEKAFADAEALGWEPPAQ